MSVLSTFNITTSYCRRFMSNNAKLNKRHFTLSEIALEKYLCQTSSIITLPTLITTHWTIKDG